ncbi:catalase-like domain-containing protein [Mrakia frigida]|uniref:catalase n=1 Tax=Mrakia frigida TaxID=29902 RepID=UPI003FCBFFDA
MATTTAPPPNVFTDSNGVPQPSAKSAQRAGNLGPLLLQDFQLIDALSHFDRERIPERVVHAKGHGAHGTWETTEDVSDLCCAKFLEKGKKSPVVARFSTVGGESGSSDSARDPRGFSLKVKTEEGNWDFVGNNTPVFFLRDPAKFPLFIHTQKRNPATNLKDANAFWDYLSLNPESIHQVMILFSDRGTPQGFRHMNGYGGHTFKWVNANGEWKYVQIHMISDQGIKTYTGPEAAKMDGVNPDSAGQDLVEAIARGENPSWTVSVQVMTPEQAKEFRYSVLDLTKIWSHKDFPLRKIGKFTLDRNVDNYFAEIEQVAFSPSHLVPGMEPSNDPVLQSRLFSYPDTHRHRLGPNYQQIPINACPFATVNNFQRGGAMNVNGGGGSMPNYPASANALTYAQRPYNLADIADPLDGPGVSVFESEMEELDYEQPRALWEKVFDEGAKERFVENVSGHMSGITRPEVTERQLGVFSRVSPDLGERLKKALAELGGDSKL